MKRYLWVGRGYPAVGGIRDRGGIQMSEVFVSEEVFGGISDSFLNALKPASVNSGPLGFAPIGSIEPFFKDTSFCVVADYTWWRLEERFDIRPRLWGQSKRPSTEEERR